MDGTAGLQLKIGGMSGATDATPMHTGNMNQ